MSAPISARARLVAGVIGLMALGAAASQVSASVLQGPDVTVRYGDLDLRTRGGAETLYVRIQRAAAQVCRQSDSLELVQRAGAMRCQNALVAHTVASLGSPQLVAVYAAHHSDHRPV
jgi:UrcA family protein